MNSKTISSTLIGIIIGATAFAAILFFVCDRSPKYVTFTQAGYNTKVYVRCDCVSSVSTLNGETYINQTNGDSIHVAESADRVCEVLKIK